MKSLKLLLFSILLISQSLIATADESNKVFVSIKPIHSIVSGLMKGLPEPHLLVNGTQSPYDYVPTNEQIENLQSASLVIWVGPELEKHLAPVIAALPPSVEVIELLADPALKILPARLNPDNRDPIFWMDERNILILLDSLARTLMSVDDKRTHIYTRNRYEMIIPLRRLDKQHEFGYRGMKAGLAVQYYDTLQYFEQAYALGVLERLADSPFQETQSDNILTIHQLLKDGDAVCLLLDASLDEKHAPLLTKDTQANIAQLDVFGVNFEPGPDMYIKLMQYNSDTIKQCLNADQSEAEQARLAAESAEMVTVDGMGGHFMLSNHLGQMVTDKDLQGHYSLIFFGYTNCPDICPMGLATISRTLKIMGEKSKELIPYFISVDPQRDSIAHLNDYVNFFDPRIVGLTGNEAMINRLVKHFRVKFNKVAAANNNPDDYSIDHTASFFLMSPDGTFMRKFANAITPEDLAAELEISLGFQSH